MNDTLYRMDIKLKQSDAEIAQALIFEYIQYGWEEESLNDEYTLIRLHCEDANILDSVKKMLVNTYPYAEFSSETIQNKDWTEAWKQYFTPVHAGDFLVLPSWDKETVHEEGVLPIYIEPKSAFGTGHHATTALCLHAITKLKQENKLDSNKTFLDLGCGTGILGIACQRLGMKGLCVDIDPIAITNTEENITLNNAEKDIKLAVGSIDTVSEQQSNYDTKYNLVIANILAGPLKVLAEEIIAAIDEKGFLILSGILSSQVEDVCSAYSKLGSPFKLEAQDIPHLCPENIATDEIKPAETWAALIFSL